MVKHPLCPITNSKDTRLQSDVPFHVLKWRVLELLFDVLLLPRARFASCYRRRDYSCSWLIQRLAQRHILTQAGLSIF
eukprot:5681879-Amphidinium_carterae.2